MADERLAWVDGWPLAAAVGGLAALPTLVSAAIGPNFIVDDWYFAESARSEGLAPFLRGSDVRSRPLQALYHGITFVVLDAHPVVHLLLLAALNATVAVLFLKVVRTQVGPAGALAAVAWWLVLPNRGAMRFWISTGPTALALVLVLVSAWAALTPRPRPVLAVTAAVLSGLCYEAGLALAAAAAAVAVFRATGGRRRTIALGALAFGLAALAAWIYLTSPKGGTLTRALAGAGTLLHGLLGTSLIPDQFADVSVVFIVAVLAVIVIALLPRLREPESFRLIVAGLVVTALGAAPVAVAGLPFAAHGPLDRVNTFALLGVALLLGGVTVWLGAMRGKVGFGAAAVGLAVVASANVHDLADAHAASDDGLALIATLARLDPAPGPIIIDLYPAEHRGWLPFGYGSLRFALRMEEGKDLDVVELPGDGPEPIAGRRYRFEEGKLVPAAP